MNNDFKIVLETVLDKSGVNTGLKEVQAIINKYALEITPDLKTSSLKNQIKQISDELAGVFNKKFDLNITGNDISKAISKQLDAINKLQSKVESIQNLEISGKYDVDLSKAQADFEKYGLSAEDAKKKLFDLYEAKDSLDSALNNGNAEQVISSNKKWLESYKRIGNEIKLLGIEEQKLKETSTNDTAIISDEKRITALIKLSNFQANNTAITKEGKIQLQAWINTLKGTDVTFGTLKNINLEFKQLETSMRSIGKLGLSTMDSYKGAIDSFQTWIGATSIVMGAVNTVRKMKDAVYEVDGAMTNLFKVTDATDEQYDSFLSNAGAKARELGNTITGLVNQTSEWARLGYSLEESSKLAEISSIYANVGEVDDQTAVQDLVTILKAFDIDAKNSVEIIDSLNALGNKYAVSSKDLGSGLRTSASALEFAGNDMHEALAMITGMTEITQNATESGNALKVLSMRLRGMKGKLEEIGEDFEGIESASKIQTQIYNLTSGKVNIMDELDPTKFKSTYEILKQISAVWSQLSQVDQSSLLEIMAGKQRGNSVAALLKSFQAGQVDKALNDSINSEGSADEEFSKWLGSLEAKISQFKAVFQSLSQNIVDSDFLKNIVDGGTTLLSVLDGIIDKTGVLAPLIAGLATFLTNKNFGRAKLSCPY